MREEDILFEAGDFWVCREDYGTGRLRPKTKGYAVWKSGLTHSIRAATIGFEGAVGLEKAIAEAKKRNAQNV